MAHLHLNELSLICDMWLNKITYLLNYLLTPHAAVTQFKHEQCCRSVDVKFTAGHILQLH